MVTTSISSPWIVVYAGNYNFFSLYNCPEHLDDADAGHEIFVQILLTLKVCKEDVADAFIVDDADADGRERATWLCCLPGDGSTSLQTLWRICKMTAAAKI